MSVPKCRRTRNRPDATGRSDTSRFVRLDYRMLSSNAYRGLSPNERALLVELAMLYNGKNNGSLYLGVHDAAHRMGVADTNAASRAFDRLQALGFIKMTQDAHFQVKASDRSRARCWRLTWLAGPGRKGPSMDFMDREPEPQSPECKRMERGLRVLKAYRKARDGSRLPVLDSDTLSQFTTDLRPGAVLDYNTAIAENGGISPIDIVRESNAHIAITMGEAVRSGLGGIW